MIVGDLVEWLGKALEKAAEAHRPVRHEVTRLDMRRNALLHRAYLVMIADSLGLKSLESQRSAMDRGIRVWGTCDCGEQFGLDIGDVSMVMHPP